MPREKVYMQYFCKNLKCNNGFIDEDLRGRMTPEKWKYCDECIEKYGFVNPDRPPESKLSRKQEEILKNNAFRKGENHKKFKRKK